MGCWHKRHTSDQGGRSHRGERASTFGSPLSIKIERSALFKHALMNWTPAVIRSLYGRNATEPRGGKKLKNNSQGTGQLDRCTWSSHTRIPGEFQCRPVSVSRPRLRPLSQVADFAVGIIQEPSFLNKRITFCFLFSSSRKKEKQSTKVKANSDTVVGSNFWFLSVA